MSTFFQKLSSNGSRTVKFASLGYIGIAAASSFVFSYQSGKEGLYTYRQELKRVELSTSDPKNKNQPPDYPYVHGRKATSPQHAIQIGIIENSWHNGWRSVTWPVHIAETVTSELVYALNKDDK